MSPTNTKNQQGQMVPDMLLWEKVWEENQQGSADIFMNLDIFGKERLIRMETGKDGVFFINVEIIFPSDFSRITPL